MATIKQLEIRINVLELIVVSVLANNATKLAGGVDTVSRMLQLISDAHHFKEDGSPDDD